MNCPLCSASVNTVVETLGVEELIRLWKLQGYELGPQEMGVLNQKHKAELFQCEHCGFRFFDPTLAGEAALYEALFLQKGSGYYTVDRPEFSFALELSKKENYRRILDVGCGDGAFLQSARQQGMETFGIELTPASAAKARARGLEVRESVLQKCTSQDFRGLMDIICLFQVLEHVSDPIGMIRTALPLLRPGGSLVIGVPNENGVYSLFPLDAHQWPPHHVSRWKKADFTELARQTGLELVRSDSDVLYGSTLEHFLLSQVRAKKMLDSEAQTMPPWLINLIGFLYRKAGVRYYGPHWGMSIYVQLRKPI